MTAAQLTDVRRDIARLQARLAVAIRRRDAAAALILGSQLRRLYSYVGS